MALFDQLPVYKQCYDLLLHLYQISKNMDKDHKYTLGESMKKEVMALIILIYRANSTHDKRELLLRAKERVEVIRLLLRVYKDLKQIALERFVDVSEKVENISKQINGWAKFEGEKVKNVG